MNKKKKTIPMLTTLLLYSTVPVIVILILITAFVPKAIYNEFHDEVEHELLTVCNLTDVHYGDIDGDWHLRDGKLHKGEFNVTDDHYLTTGKEDSIDLTIFYGDTRYATSILTKDGKPLLNTQCSDEVAKQVLTEGKSYMSDDLIIEGVNYFGYYKPLVNKDKVVGMTFAGKPVEAIKQHG